MDHFTERYTDYTASMFLARLSALVVNNSIFNWQFGDTNPRTKNPRSSAPETSILPGGRITNP
jgi:hypothetical protein